MKKRPKTKANILQIQYILDQYASCIEELFAEGREENSKETDKKVDHESNT